MSPPCTACAAADPGKAAARTCRRRRSGGRGRGGVGRVQVWGGESPGVGWGESRCGRGDGGGRGGVGPYLPEELVENGVAELRVVPAAELEQPGGHAEMLTIWQPACQAIGNLRGYRPI